MDLIQYLTNHQAQVLYVVAGISFVVELTVMGLSGPLLFFAIASFITAIMTSFGLVSGWESVLFSLGLITAVVAGLLWKPLKSFQNHGPGNDSSSDMIGLKVVCNSKITSSPGTVRYSGIDWTAKLSENCSDTEIEPGTTVQIEAITGNTLYVKPVSMS